MFLQQFAKKLAIVEFLLFGVVVYSHGQFTPSDIGGMELWLDGHIGLTVSDNLVQQWDDQSSNARHATSPAPSVQPELYPNGFNGHPVISFDGISDFFSFTEISNAQTFFWVMKENQDAAPGSPRPLMGWIGGFNFLRGPDKTFWDNQYAHVGVRNGTTRLNLQQINPFTTEVPSQFFIASLKTSEIVQASHLTQELGIYYRSWWGEIAEIIIYSAALTDEEILQVEGYLANKYGPVFTQIPDLTVPYGFCNTEICAPENFNEYTWSTGEQTQCIDVGASGEYSVTMTDIFGRTFSDTLIVSFPGNVQLPSTSIICVGNAFTWDLQLSEADYTFQWSNSSTLSTVEIFNPGDYTLTITDNNSCSFTKDFHIDVDSLSSLITLGPDQNLCSGNFIGLLPHSFSNLLYQWNTNSPDSSIMVNNTGEYNVAVTDAFGCMALDTIYIEILGTAPELGFNALGLCEDAQTVLNATYTEIIESFNWQFGDNSVAVGESVTHSYDTPGDYSVTLYAVAASGCASSFSNTIHVYQKPFMQFSINQSCQNLPVVFMDLSSSVEGTLLDWNWVIDGIEYNGAEVNTSFGVSGFYNIHLEGTDNHACTAQLDSFIEILPSPVVDFTTSGLCHGVLTSFISVVDNAQTGNVTSYAWNFGDDTGSSLIHPTHYYPQSGNYDVALQVNTANGCGDIFNENITIFAKPIADFDIRNACQNMPYTFVNESTSGLEDPIAQWQWVVNSQTTLNGISPSHIFVNTGLVPVTLQVSTEQGCTDFVAQQIPVWSNPIAAFSFTPEIGASPFEVQYANESVGSTMAHWMFGDSHESDEFNPAFTFTLNGTYYTQLIATNTAGCMDTTGRIITVAVPRYETALQQIELHTTPAGNVLTARVVNTGNIEIAELFISWQIGNDAPVTEVWNGTLAPGMTLNYEFHSLMHFVGHQYPYLCVEANPVSPFYSDMNQLDNVICKSTSVNDFILMPPFPNPSHDQLFIRFITPTDGDINIYIYDMLGRRVMEMREEQLVKGFHQYYVDVTQLPQGHYQLAVITANAEGVVSFMKRNE